MNTKVIRYAYDVAKKDVLIKLGILSQRCFNAPYTITFSITDTCNAKCITCDRWKNKDDSQELSINEWKHLLDRLSKWINPCYIAFTGGEPFVKRDFAELLEYASKLDVYSHVSTNGIVFNEKNYDSILNTGVNFLLFSLNSIDPQIHNHYKGVNNLHQKVVSAIKYIKKKNSGVRVGITLVITKDNYRTLNDFVQWTYNLGVDSINFQPIMDNFGPNFSPNPSICASTLNPYWRIDDLQELDRQIDLLIYRKKKGFPIVVPIDELKKLKVYFRNPIRIPKRYHCDVGFRNLIISATGDVKLCYPFPTIGNIQENDIRNIWFSKKAQAQRINMLRCNKPCVSACLRSYNLLEKFLNFLIRVDFKCPKF